MKVALSLVVASLTTTGLARAQPLDAPPSTDTYPASPAPSEAPSREQRPRAPKNALELTVGAGYTQGFGSLRSGVGMPSVATPGLGVDVGAGYRANPSFAVLWSGQYHELTSQRTAAARGFTSTIAAQYHLSPMRRVDPWVELGVGYRVLVEDPGSGPNLVTHGFQIGRARVGIDIRASESEAIALGPTIGVDATMFMFQDFPNTATNIPDPRMSTFIFAGVQGRFDVGGKASAEPETISSR